MTSSHLGYIHKDTAPTEIHVLGFLVDVNSGDTIHTNMPARTCRPVWTMCTPPEPPPGVVTLSALTRPAPKRPGVEQGHRLRQAPGVSPPLRFCFSSPPPSAPWGQEGPPPPAPGQCEARAQTMPHNQTHEGHPKATQLGAASPRPSGPPGGQEGFTGRPWGAKGAVWGVASGLVPGTPA